MNQKVTLEFIEEKNDENENNDNFYSDIDCDDEGYEQKISVIEAFLDMLIHLLMQLIGGWAI